MSPGNIEGGYVHLYRRLWDHPVFRDLTEAAVFVWMVSMAAWRPTRVRYKNLTITLARGQLAISSRDLATKWGWSEAKARRYLDRLQTDAMTDAATDAGVNVVTICNYNEYQSSAGESDAPSDAAPTQHRRSTDAQNKEGNKGKKENIRDIPPVSPAESKSTASKGTRIAEDWSPGEKGTAYALGKGFALDQIGTMADHFHSDRTAKGVVMKDWDAAWRTWVNNDIKWHGAPQQQAERSRCGPRPQRQPQRSQTPLQDAFDDLLSRVNERTQ